MITFSLYFLLLSLFTGMILYALIKYFVSQYRTPIILILSCAYFSAVFFLFKVNSLVIAGTMP